MGHAEGLVHIGVEALDQRGDEVGVVGLLPGVEAQVLAELDAGTQGGQALAHRVHLPAGVAGGGRPAQMRAGHHLGALVQQPAQRRQRGGDAEVVGHRGPAVDADVERDVEVDPHQHASPFEVGEVLKERQAVQWVHRISSPTSRVRSTSRLE